MLKFALPTTRRVHCLAVATIFALFASEILCAGQRQTDKTSQSVAQQSLRSDLLMLFESEDLKNCHVGVSVYSHEFREYLFKRNDEHAFTPASLMKLFTTAAALYRLGPDFRFHTVIQIDTLVSHQGEYLGNLIVRGTGDPTWSPLYRPDALSVFDTWAQIIDTTGIEAIRGSIIGDDDYFDDTDHAPGWAWDDLSYNYAPPIGALNVNGNSVSVVVQPPRFLTDITTVRLRPETGYMRVINGVRTVDSTGPTDVRVLRELNSNVVDIFGTASIASNRDSLALAVSVANPTLYSLSFLRTALVNRGIRVKGQLVDIDDWSDTLDASRYMSLAVDHSPPLSQMIRTINMHSDNLGAEALLKTMGRLVLGDGSFERGCDVVRNFLRRYDVKTNNMVMVDGSGLSRLNLCTPDHIIKLFVAMRQHAYGEVFFTSLAAPGQPGTMQRRLTGSRAEKFVRAKTGSLNNISNIAGIVTTRDGETLFYTIMVNNITGPIAPIEGIQDMIAMRLAAFSRK